MHGSILLVTIPPGQPLGQLLPFGPGGGELLEAVLSQGQGVEQIFVIPSLYAKNKVNGYTVRMYNYLH